MNEPFTVDWIEGHRVDVATLQRSAVVGIGHVLTLVDSLVARLRDPDRAARFGLQPPRGLLFHGDPGVGKTMVARYLALKLGADVPFYEVACDEISPERARGMLRHLADAHPRSVLYLDEVDTFAADRDWRGHDTESRQVLVALLAGLDGLVSTAGPIVIGSTSRDPSDLDQALLRPGRLGIHLEFDVPSERERVALLELFLAAIPTEGVDLTHAARLTRDWTPAELRQAVDMAAATALAAERAVVTGEDLLEAIHRDGRVRRPMPPEARFRTRHAVHEAGHAVVAGAVRGPEWVYSVEITDRGGATQVGEDALPTSRLSDDELLDLMVVQHAGVLAETAVLGAATRGSRHDIRDATDLAIDRFSAGLTDDPAPFDPNSLRGDASEALKDRLGRSVIDQLHVARSRATALVDQHLDAIIAIAHLIEARGSLSGPELHGALAEALATEGTAV